MRSVMTIETRAETITAPTKNNGNENLKMHHQQYSRDRICNEDIRNICEIQDITRWAKIKR